MQHAPITTPITDKLASMTWIRWFRQLVDRVDEIKGTSDAPGWETITGKPTEFPPSEHRHEWTDLDDVPTALALNDLTDVDTTSNAEGDLLRRGADGNWYPAHVTISESAPVSAPGALDWIWFVVDPL